MVWIGVSMQKKRYLGKLVVFHRVRHDVLVEKSLLLVRNDLVERDESVNMTVNFWEKFNQKRNLTVPSTLRLLRQLFVNIFPMVNQCYLNSSQSMVNICNYPILAHA